VQFWPLDVKILLKEIFELCAKQFNNILKSFLNRENKGANGL
jgi:hypothetical protein